jgi:monoamine oxidase
MSVKLAPGMGIDVSAHIADGSDFDVVIVGAGMSGLYSAWRIGESWRESPALREWAAERPDGKLRIAILEWSDRVGGRIDTRIVADMENVPAEVGGMRFTKDHKIVSMMVEQFKLPTEPFPMTKDSQFCLRSYRFDETCIQAGTPVPYALSPDEKKQTPNQLFNYAIKKICNYSNEWTDANWQWIKQNYRYSDAVYDNVHLYDIGFWNILYRTLSNEGYDYVWDGGGYNSNTINWNAAEAMPYMTTDFSVTPSYLRIKTGYHQLAVSLAKAVRAQGTPIVGNTRLVRFDKQGDRTIGRVRPTAGGSEATFKTRALMLALPQKSLQLIDQDCEFFENKRVQYCIQSVLPQPSYKLFIAYDKRWWDKSAFYPGPTITDMPLRMTYDFGSEEERGGKPGDTRTLLLASYADMNADSFWSVLERETPYTQPPSDSRIAADGGANAPPTMQRMAESMLVQVFEMNNVQPKPAKIIGAYYQDWSQEPYGAGYHAWAAHYKVWEVMREVRKPMPDRHVYIFGEAYSNAQGWVEGAFCTAESVLTDFLRLPLLKGLDPHYPLLTPEPVEPGNEESHPTYFMQRTSLNVF